MGFIGGLTRSQATSGASNVDGIAVVSQKSRFCYVALFQPEYYFVNRCRVCGIAAIPPTYGWVNDRRNGGLGSRKDGL